MWDTLYNDPLSYYSKDAVSSAAASSVPPIISVVLASPANWATNAILPTLASNDGDDGKPTFPLIYTELCCGCHGAWLI